MTNQTTRQCANAWQGSLIANLRYATNALPIYACPIPVLA